MPAGTAGLNASRQGWQPEGPSKRHSRWLGAQRKSTARRSRETPQMAGRICLIHAVINKLDDGSEATNSAGRAAAPSAVSGRSAAGVGYEAAVVSRRRSTDSARPACCHKETTSSVGLGVLSRQRRRED
jgi:hypothetical protein